MTRERTRSALLLATTIAIAACANRAASNDVDGSYDDSTVQVVERKPVRTPDLTVARTVEPTPPARAAVDDSFFACTDSADCVVLETGCCDHCNGGGLVAVNNRYSDAATDAFRQRSCGDDSACTKAACEWSYTAVCDAGTCARMEEHALGKAGATVVVVHNAPMP